MTRWTISKTVCVKGWTKKIRPPESYTTTLNKKQLAQWNYVDQNPSHACSPSGASGGRPA